MFKYMQLTFWELRFWEVDILGVDIFGVDILGVDILGVDILGVNILGRTPSMALIQLIKVAGLFSVSPVWHSSSFYLKLLKPSTTSTFS